MSVAEINLSPFIGENTLNASIIRSYTEFNSQTCLTLKSDTNDAYADYLMFAQKSDDRKASLPIEKLTATDLDAWHLFPLLTPVGLHTCHKSDSKLNVSTLALYGIDSQITLNERQLHIANHRKHELKGAVCSGSFDGEPIYGYVSLEEAKHLLPACAKNDIRIIELVCLEAALYRSIYRLDKQSLSQELRDLIQMHELRNFHTFNEHFAEKGLFEAALSTVKSREDYLRGLSNTWQVAFEQESMFLAYSLARIGTEHSFTLDRIKMEAYSVATIAAEKDLSLSPISGELCIASRAGEKHTELYLYETVKGKLNQAYNSSGLTSVVADVVYTHDSFEFSRDEQIRHSSNQFEQQQRGEILGAYASLKYSDGSYSNAFIEKKELIEVGKLSSNAAWSSVYFTRMWMKHCIAEALNQRTAPIEKKPCNSRYLT